MKVYERITTSKSAKQIAKLVDEGYATFENAVQRSLVWRNDTKDNRKSKLIDSILRGFPIPPMYANATKVKTMNKYDFIDGKQRINTIHEFMNDKFQLINIPAFNLDVASEDDTVSNEIVDLNGLKYSELPQKFKDSFDTFMFSINYYENMPQDDLAEMFARLNNGKPLSAIELTRVSCKSFDRLKEIASHDIFVKALSDKQLRGYTNEDIVIKSWIMLNKDNPSLETKDVRPIMEKAEITQEDEEILSKIYDRLLEAYKYILADDSDEKLNNKIAKRIITRTHLISLIPFVKRSLDDNISLENFAIWLQDFYSGVKSSTKNESYNSNSTSGSNKLISVRARHLALDKDYELFKKHLPKEPKVEEPKVEEQIEEQVEEQFEEQVEEQFEEQIEE